MTRGTPALLAIIGMISLTGCVGDLPSLGQAQREPILKEQTVPALLSPARENAVYLPAEPRPLPQYGPDGTEPR